MHSYADASESGYGACIYLKSVNKKGNIQVSLLAAKSRVLPMKKISLPHVELCAAVLAAQLAKKFKSVLNLNLTQEYFWSDSQIVLCWIKATSNKWKTYVVNRVSEIQTLTNNDNWFHENSRDNPADLMSRGMLPNDVSTSNLWWHGPHWLNENLNEVSINHTPLVIAELPEKWKEKSISSHYEWDSNIIVHHQKEIGHADLLQ